MPLLTKSLFTASLGCPRKLYYAVHKEQNDNTNSYSLILSPHNHPSTQKEVASLAGNLSPDFKDKLQSVSLEQFVKSLIANSPAPFRATFEKFYNRYLDIEF